LELKGVFAKLLKPDNIICIRNAISRIRKHDDKLVRQLTIDKWGKISLENEYEIGELKLDNKISENEIPKFNIIPKNKLNFKKITDIKPLEKGYSVYGKILSVKAIPFKLKDDREVFNYVG